MSSSSSASSASVADSQSQPMKKMLSMDDEGAGKSSAPSIQQVEHIQTLTATTTPIVVDASATVVNSPPPAVRIVVAGSTSSTIDQHQHDAVLLNINSPTAVNPNQNTNNQYPSSSLSPISPSSPSVS